jgi:hypothetical protein
VSDLLKLGSDAWQITDQEAEELKRKLQEGGPGLFPEPPIEYTGGLTLAAALARVQEEIPEVVKGATARIPGKDGKQGYSYSYANLADVTRAILPILGKHGLSWITKPTLLDGRFVLIYKLAHACGETEEGVYPLPDRGTPQEIGSAITYARRYALTSVTGVAPDDEDDDAAEATASHGRNTMTNPPMSDYERSLGRALLRVPTPQEREQAGPALMYASFVQALDFRACLNERGAWRQAVAEGSDQTWEELFVERVVLEIASVDTPEEWRTIRGELKQRDLDMTYQGQRFSQLLNARALEIQQAQAALVNEITASVVNAVDIAETDAAWTRATVARQAGLLTEDQLTEVATIVGDRRNRLQREQNQAATS